MKFRRYALLLATLLLAACSYLPFFGLDSPRVTVTNLAPLEMGLFEQRFEMRLRIQNPNSVALPVRGMQYALELNGRDFASGVSNQDINIPAYGEEMVNVIVTTSIASFFRQLGGLQANDLLGYRLSGTMALANRSFKLPFEYAGEMDFKY